MVSARTKKSNPSELEQKGECIAGRLGVERDPGLRGFYVSLLLSPNPLPSSICVTLILLLVGNFLERGSWPGKSTSPIYQSQGRRVPISQLWGDSNRPCVVTSCSPGAQSLSRKREDGEKHAGQAKIVTSTVFDMAAIFEHGKLLISE